jgi:hypothetical protein
MRGPHGIERNNVDVDTGPDMHANPLATAT